MPSPPRRPLGWSDGTSCRASYGDRLSGGRAQSDSSQIGKTTGIPGRPRSGGKRYKESGGGGLKLRSGYALPSFQASDILILIDAPLAASLSRYKLNLLVKFRGANTLDIHPKIRLFTEHSSEPSHPASDKRNDCDGS